MQGTTFGKDIIFYDGTCGLCHGFVRWVLAHDAEGKFLLSPLQGETLKQIVSDEERLKLPDSVVVRRTDGTLLTKSVAVAYVADKLGSHARAGFIRFFRRWPADLGYDFVAKVRYAVFGRNRGDMCPILPPELRDRFLP
jgi:predicted DCC family thiol-disulfide oxidoreductase YuxK